MRIVLAVLVVVTIQLIPAITRSEIAVAESKMEYIDAAMESILGEIGYDKEGVDEFVDAIMQKFEQLKEYYDHKKINYCLDKYINAELDFVTPGNRGLGRLTEFIPRFGAYFREALLKASTEDLTELYDTIREVMLGAYLCRVLFVEEPVSQPAISSGEDLFEKWIPGVYSSSSSYSEMDENLLEALMICTDSAFEKLKILTDALEVKSGESRSADWVDIITYHYAIAGFGLRAVETTGY